MGINQIIGMQIKRVIHSLNLGNKNQFYAFQGILLIPIIFYRIFYKEKFWYISANKTPVGRADHMQHHSVFIIMLKHLVSFATSRQTQGGNWWHHQEWWFVDSPCSQTSSHNPKLVWCAQSPTSHLLLGNSSHLLPAAGGQLIPVRLWCVLAQPLWCPHWARARCSLGIATAPAHQTAASRWFYWGQYIARENSRTWDRKLFNSALKAVKGDTRMKEMKNAKAREGHEDLEDIALYRCSSVSLQAPFSSLQTPPQAVAAAAIPQPNL